MVTIEEKRIGRQTPTQSVVLPYTKTLGGEAVELYNKSGRTAQQWQELQLYDIMARNDENLWVHMKYGYSVPRRNGKSEIIIMRSMWGLVNGERVLYTAHRTNTSHSIWEKVVTMLGKAGFVEKEDFITTKQYGLEHIEWVGGDGVMNFRTRSSKGGLGEGYDLLIIDEAQEYTDDQETALKYLVTSSTNPQTLMCGTPPTAVSSGTVFQKFRQNVLSGGGTDDGWAEWSVPKISNVKDVDLWYETNPSLGQILTERTIRSELTGNSIDQNIQRLGLWIEYNLKSAISKQEWQDCKLTAPPNIDNKQLFFGVKYGKTNDNVSLSVAVKTTDNKIFVESIDCRPIREGNNWIIPYLLNPHAKAVVIDGDKGRTILEADMKNANVKTKAILPTTREVIECFSLFENNLFARNICHMGQPSLEQVATNCEHRAIGSGGGFGYQSISDGADITLLESVALAYWACSKTKVKRVQKITY